MKIQNFNYINYCMVKMQRMEEIMKKISIVLPVFNEENNISELIETIEEIFISKLDNYDYEIIISDNHSTDNSRMIIRKLCKHNNRIKAIFNAKNFRDGSGANALSLSTGDCTIFMASDFQDPPYLIPIFIEEWEKGNKIVIGIKNKSETNFFMHFLRTIYYKIINYISDSEQIPHFTGFGLYDKTFLNEYNKVSEAEPYFRGFVAKFGFKIKTIEFTQPKRKSGMSSNKFKTLYDIAMRGITTYSKYPIRILTFIGVLIMLISFIFLIVNIICFLYYKAYFLYIMFEILFFFNGLSIFSFGIIGEYILSINKKLLKFPRVIEEERINF